jgi:GTP-binding protein
MSFVDEARIIAIAGSGGNGAVAWRREPYNPKGGPEGGDGGAGGSVVVRADASVATLLEARDRPHVKAERGRHGEGKRRHGSRGADRVVRVPPGTLVYAADDTLLADLARSGDEMIAAAGGRGGRGNARFATAFRRSPSFAERGEPGEEATLRLELRLIADVGLVGFPNAGKSTLIARVSAARPRTASYPFTTLVPSLGVLRRDDESFVMADIPGLVEGAHEGRGLGDRFLRHVSRAAVLAFIADLDAPDRNPASDIDVLRAELEAFDPELATRPHVVVANKVDAQRARARSFVERWPDALMVSGLTGEGVEPLLDVLFERVRAARRERPEPAGYLRHVVRQDRIRVEREGTAWRVLGRRAENAVITTDLDSDEAVSRLQRRLIAMGVERALSAAGARAGDEIRIGDGVFDFEPEPEGAGSSSQ